MWSHQHAARSSILFSLLNRDSESPRRLKQPCSCSPRTKLVSIRAPHSVFKAASEVLVKTFRFVKHVPCFRGLPAGDQLRLVRSSWAPLLLLGMAQDCVDLDTVETQQPSLLHKILTHSANRFQEPGVPAGDAEGIRMFVERCRGLRISVREYALLKGAVLFNPVVELECRDYVRALQREAERALYEHVRTVHRGNTTSRFKRLRAALGVLRSMDTEAVSGLIFRPSLGTSSVDAHVLTLFYEQ
ncbi:nuclear receptor subfamily 0 group B member 1-like [Cheilinus undulatus]|uniref:nuclear receptor subfamily 0 group B member 1-like n=1 Tax=Cheilinus undulatus TaxID=241271 RepID=UPI001BD480C2|nr:nuclear receptor subfamily 0 group B member 1-like [Cheilinus undulatus]